MKEEKMVNFSSSSGLLTGSGIVSRLPCLLTGLEVITNGTDAATLILYNSLDNSGKVLAKYVVVGAELSKEIDYAIPLQATVGVYAALSGTGANAIVYFTPE